MKFVTKKEFDDALAIIESALEAGQVSIQIHNEVPVRLHRFYFTETLTTWNTYSPEAVTFTVASQAVKNRLHDLRKDLKSKRDSFNKDSQALEALEKEEKQLVSTLTVVKE